MRAVLCIENAVAQFRWHGVTAASCQAVTLGARCHAEMWKSGHAVVVTCSQAPKLEEFFLDYVCCSVVANVWAHDDPHRHTAVLICLHGKLKKFTLSSQVR